GGRQYNTLDELWAAIECSARSVPRNFLEKLCNSIDSRIEKLLTKRGGHSYMDDLVIFSHEKDIDVEHQLHQLCGNYDLNLKPTKRQVLTEGDITLLGVMFIDGGKYITVPPVKFEKFQTKVPAKDCTYADLLSTLGPLDESPAIPPWALALKHFAQSLVARERADRSVHWSAKCTNELRELVLAWHSMVVSIPRQSFVLYRLYDYLRPLHVYTDAAKRAGGFIFRQDGRDLLQRVYIFTESEANLPIVCLEAHTLYRAFAAVHQLELAGRRRFPEVHYHVDNVAVEATFRVGRPATHTNKDAKPILAKYVAMVNALHDPLDFGRSIYLQRVSTQQNPADALTRHELLTRFVKFADAKSIEKQDEQIELVKSCLNDHKSLGEQVDRGFIAVWSTLL
ncbi:hypothetical protein FOZ61_000587, partial [Perkinsus olseni]